MTRGYIAMKTWKATAIATMMFALLLVCTLLGCANYGAYNGKEISEICYRGLDYLGGMATERILSLDKCNVTEAHYFSGDGRENAEFTVTYTFERESVSAFLSEANRAGLFNINEYYENKNVDDGGEWQLSVCYKDGTSKISRGINKAPTEVFKKADVACYNLFGGYLLGYLPSDYTTPPSFSMAVAFDYSEGNTHHSSNEQVYCVCTNYTWRKERVEGVDNIASALNAQREPLETHDYTLVLYTSNLTEKFSNLVVNVYQTDGKGNKEVLNSGWFTQKEIPMELNRVYVITVTYEYGVCQYCFATCTEI